MYGWASRETLHGDGDDANISPPYARTACRRGADARVASREARDTAALKHQRQTDRQTERKISDRAAAGSFDPAAPSPDPAPFANAHRVLETPRHPAHLDESAQRGVVALVLPQAGIVGTEHRLVRRNAAFLWARGNRRPTECGMRGVPSIFSPP